MGKSKQQEFMAGRRKLREQLRALSFAPVMRGSVVERLRKCGRPNCACASDPERRHAGKYLSVNLQGRTQALHLRPDDEQAVREATENYARLWKLIESLTALELGELRRLAAERRRGRGRRRA